MAEFKDAEFSYVYVPADPKISLELHRSSKAGGLENDALRKRAELFFGSKSIDKASQHFEVVKQLKEGGMADADVADAMSKFGDKLAGNVEIIALSLPHRCNHFESVSLYCDGNNRFRTGDDAEMPNIRATALARACGHKTMTIMGACFIGRAQDDERVEWERLDFALDDMSTISAWAVEAARMNEGKNMSSWSSSGIAQNMAKEGEAKKNKVVELPPEPEPPLQVPAEGYWWTQDQDEVELRMPVPADLPAKSFLCIIKSSSLTLGNKRVHSAQGSAVEGLNPKLTASEGAALGGEVVVGDCSWSIQAEKECRMLTITLAKKGKKHWKSLLA